MSSFAYRSSRLAQIPRHLQRSLHSRYLSSSSSAADQVRIVEVGTRDGLQNEKQGSIATETKVELIRRLVKTGVRNVEAGSFVSSKWVPQVC